MNKEKIALWLGSGYGVRVVRVIEDESGKYRIVELNPPIWVNSWYSDNPPCDEGCYSFADDDDPYENYWNWIPIDDEEDV